MSGQPGSVGIIRYPEGTESLNIAVIDFLQQAFGFFSHGLFDAQLVGDKDAGNMRVMQSVPVITDYGIDLVTTDCFFQPAFFLPDGI